MKQKDKLANVNQIYDSTFVKNMNIILFLHAYQKTTHTVTFISW